MIYLKYLMATLLLQTAAMSTAQQFRAVMAVLADANTFRKGVFMRSAVQSGVPSPPPKAAFHRHFGIAFVDASGWLNFASNLSSSGLAEVKRVAGRNVLMTCLAVYCPHQLLFLCSQSRS